MVTSDDLRKRQLMRNEEAEATSVPRPGKALPPWESQEHENKAEAGGKARVIGGDFLKIFFSLLVCF